MTSRSDAAEMTLETAAALLRTGRLQAVIRTLCEEHVRLGDAEVGELTAAALEVRALAEGLSFALTAEADSRGVIAASTAGGTSQWVRRRGEESGISLSTGVAQGFAEVTAATRSPGMVGLKDAVSTGWIPLSGARVVAVEFKRMRSKIDPACHEPALEQLINYCAGGASGRELGQARDVIVSQYGLPGEFQDECDERATNRHVTAFRRTREGMYAARVELDPASHAVVEAALTALSAPTPAEDGFADLRTPGQRRADALVEVCSVVATDPEMLSRSEHTPAGAPTGRAARARVVVTMPWTWLTEQTGHGRTGFDQPVAPGDVRRMACDAQIVPMVLGSASQPLDVGRGSRLATPAQRAALAERDRGCTFPGCDRPPSWCEAHHLHEWGSGGRTDIDELALLCGRHHTVVHRDGLTGAVEGPPGERGSRVVWRPPGHARAPAA